MITVPQFIIIIIGGLLLGIGAMKVWHGESSIKRTKVRGQKREYYTVGDIWVMKLRAKIRNMKQGGV